MSKKGKINYAKYGYLFCIPFTLAWLIFSLYPTLYTAIIGFTDLHGVNASAIHFKSDIFENYKWVLHSPTFRTAFKNTFVIWVSNFIPQIALALFLAAFFTSPRVRLPFVGGFKVLFYMPNIITASTVAILFAALFGYPMGPVNDLLTRFHIIEKPVNWLVSKAVARNIVIFIQTWMWYGYTMIIMISGILGISPDIFEAADIDGANPWQVFWKITVPSIKTILLFFNNGGPDNATITTSVFIYAQAFKGGYWYNRASAASMIMFIIILALSGVMFFFLRDKDEAEMRKANKKAMKELKLAQKAKVEASND